MKKSLLAFSILSVVSASSMASSVDYKFMAGADTKGKAALAAEIIAYDVILGVQGNFATSESEEYSVSAGAEWEKGGYTKKNEQYSIYTGYRFNSDFGWAEGISIKGGATISTSKVDAYVRGNDVNGNFSETASGKDTRVVPFIGLGYGFGKSGWSANVHHTFAKDSNVEMKDGKSKGQETVRIQHEARTTFMVGYSF
ncbi:hypothetical protein [Vibrio nomapromontoriensis]|uniref:hypothetical protein n=1 Tax=Vibrio nomapromontoriensis TaxID=2910246 RepID=UPI003D148087